jgi:hypothetical protein
LNGPDQENRRINKHFDTDHALEPRNVISAINMYEHFMFFTISGVLKLPIYIVQFFQKWAKKPPSFGLTCPFVFWGEKVTANLHFEWQFQAHFPTGNLTSNLSQLG